LNRIKPVAGSVTPSLSSILRRARERSRSSHVHPGEISPRGLGSSCLAPRVDRQDAEDSRVEELGEAKARCDPLSGAGFVGRVLGAVAWRASMRVAAQVVPGPPVVSYDRSRSKTRVWCDMLTGDGGACAALSQAHALQRKTTFSATLVSLRIVVREPWYRPKTVPAKHGVTRDRRGLLLSRMYATILRFDTPLSW
jgi:hypothetical protein